MSRTKKIIKKLFPWLPKLYYYGLFKKSYLEGKWFPKYKISKYYKNKLHREMNWKNPQDLNEKINWLKLYSDTTMWTELADKYRVRKYVEDKGLSDILVPLVGKWDSVKNFANDFRHNKINGGGYFVVKLNNGCGDVMICKDQNQFDIDTAEKYYTKKFNTKYGYTSGEFHYAKIRPVIFAEKLLDSTKQCFKSDSLIDFKIWCFNGKPHHIWACYNRSKKSVFVEIHEPDWSYHPEYSDFSFYYLDGGGKLPRPKNLEYMLYVASKLSEGFPQVRVDLYEVDNKVYFGEMTFTSDGGYMHFYNKEFLNKMGELVTLPND